MGLVGDLERVESSEHSNLNTNLLIQTSLSISPFSLRISPKWRPQARWSRFWKNWLRIVILPLLESFSPRSFRRWLQTNNGRRNCWLLLIKIFSKIIFLFVMVYSYQSRFSKSWLPTEWQIDRWRLSVEESKLFPLNHNQLLHSVDGDFHIRGEFLHLPWSW